MSLSIQDKRFNEPERHAVSWGGVCVCTLWGETIRARVTDGRGPGKCGRLVAVVEGGRCREALCVSRSQVVLPSIWVTVKA